MPILFPLLYHECAHAAIEADKEAMRHTFFSGLDLATTLWEEAQRHEPLPKDRETWDVFADEIIADVLAVFLGGLPYVGALSMQLFGDTGGRYFERDGSPLDRLGGLGLRVWEPFRFQSSADFWEIRLRVAIALGEALEAGAPADRKQWLEDLKASLDLYHAGGAAAFQFSAGHLEPWTWRCRMVKDLSKRILDLLQAVTRRVKDLPRLSYSYRIPESLGDVITGAIRELNNSVFGPALGGASMPLPLFRDARLEDVALFTRWCFAGKVVEALSENDAGDDLVDALLDPYANYIRNDGSGAFRLALEYVLARHSVSDAVGDWLAGEDHGAAVTRGAEDIVRVAFAKDQWNPAGFSTATDIRGNPGSQLAACIWFKLRDELSNAPVELQDPASARGALREVLTYASRKLDAWCSEHVISALKLPGDGTVSAKASPLPLGTITLGLIRPAVIARSGVSANFPAALAHVENGVRKGTQRINKKMAGLARAFPDANDHKRLEYPLPNVLALLGQYNVLTYNFGITPVERRHDVPDGAPFLSKARAVFRILGGCDDLWCSPRGDDCDGKSCRRAAKNAFLSVSLIKYRYRWQVYSLRERLIQLAPDRHFACERTMGMPAEDCEIIAHKLFLSSGWEDCILVLWHEDERKMWKTYEKLKLGSSRACETVQTYLGLRLEELGKPSSETAPEQKPEETVDRNFTGTPTRGPGDTASAIGEDACECAAAPGATSQAPAVGTDTAKRDQDVGKASSGDGDEGRDPWEDCDLPLPENELLKFFSEVYERTGRYDFSVIWQAKTVKDLGTLMAQLPERFWQRTDRLSISCELQRPFSRARNADAPAKGEGPPNGVGAIRFRAEIGLKGR